MFVHRSNRTEELAGRLAEVVSRPLSSAMTPEVIVVSSLGIERWLAQELARRLGVWANARFPFPRAFIDELLAPFAREGEGEFTRERLLWTIARLLPDVAKRKGADAIASYLAEDPSDVAVFELSRQIAHVFDQYAVYRPSLVRAWSRGAGRGWQPDLFRALLDETGGAVVSTRAERFLAGSVPRTAPERVSVFGVSGLPRIYLRILSKLAREREVHVFLLAPSPHGPKGAHPLARSLGALGLDFEGLLAAEAKDAVIHDAFVDPGSRTMLEVVQADLLAGRERSTTSPDRPRAPGRPGDASIAFHSCHGPLREVEVLRDQLLAAFDADPTLEPEDVVVMAPDIDRYAPLIDAVFASEPSAPGFVPYRIADRTRTRTSRTIEAVLRVLELSKGRMKASDVLDLLQLSPVRTRFDFVAEDLPELRRLVSEAAIRWGIDASHRASQGQPPRDENTWRFGLSRLLLGQVFATEAEALDPYRGILPLPAGSPEGGELVGKLAEYCRVLFEWHGALAAPRPVADWAAAVQGILRAFVGDDEANHEGTRAVVDTVSRLAQSAADSRFDRPMDRDAWLTLLGSALDGDRTSQNFVSGGVTFCALLPMRSVPFRIVCVLGLSDADFPRRDRAPAFDLVAHRPLPGDRSVRAEDRQLFLDALLSARDRLMLFYAGRTIHENSPLPPSVVVSELADVLDASFSVGKERPGQARLAFDTPHLSPDGAGRRATVEHPLQPFSRRYFDGEDPRLVSYVAADAEGARALVEGSLSRRRFHVAPLLGTEASEVDVDELARFFENPSRGLLKGKLGVALEDESIIVSDREPVLLTPLDAYTVGAGLFARAVRGRPPESELAWARGSGLLPFGTPGDVAFTRVQSDAHALLSHVSPLLAGGRLAPVEVDANLGATVIVGLLRDIYPSGQVFARFARMKARSEVGAWIRHLALQTTGRAMPTLVLGRGTGDSAVDARRFEPIPEARARELLAALLRLRALGLQAPLCFFPRASRHFAEAWLAGQDRDEEDRRRRALDVARRTFTDSRNGPSDADDAYVRRVFDGVDPFAASPVPFDEDRSLGLPPFEEIAKVVFLPLLSASSLEEA